MSGLPSVARKRTSAGLQQTCTSPLRLLQAAVAAGLFSPISDDEFQVFVDKAAACADAPVPSLLYASSRDIESRLGNFAVEAKWLSQAPRSADDITVCTNSNFERCVSAAGALSLQAAQQFAAYSQRPGLDARVEPPCPSARRLHMLEEQCESWGGPVSASIWLPLELFNKRNGFAVEEAIQQLSELHARIEKSGGWRCCREGGASRHNSGCRRLCCRRLAQGRPGSWRAVIRRPAGTELY